MIPPEAVIVLPSTLTVPCVELDPVGITLDITPLPVIVIVVPSGLTAPSAEVVAGTN